VSDVSDDLRREMLSKQWEAATWGDLVSGEVVKVMNRCKYRGSIMYAPRDSQRFWCGIFMAKPDGTLELHDVLLDTSETYTGVTMKAKITWHQRIILVHVPALIIPFVACERSQS